MPFTEKTPGWQALGTEPPASKKTEGWQAGEKPPADYFNWFFTVVSKVLDELQQKSAEKSVLDAHIGSGGAAHENASSGSSGFMSAADKAKLDAATSAATPNTLVQRDANGRFKANAPSAADDVARKAETDAVQSNLSVHINATSGAHTASAISATGGTNVQAEIDNLKSSVSSGKSAVAAAITDMGQTAAGSDTFAQLASKIRAISSDANAGTGDVLSGKTYYQGGAKKTGTMTNRANTKFQICGYEDITEVIPNPSDPNGQGLITGRNAYNQSGYIDQNSQIQMSVRNLVPANIKAGVAVGRNNGTGSQVMIGTFTADATATAGDILSGKTAYVNGNKVTGSVPNRGSPTWTPGTSNQSLQAGYYSGGTILGDPDLIAANIRQGVNIFGVVGTLVEGKPAATGSFEGGTVPYQVTGLSFTPNFVVLFPTGYNEVIINYPALSINRVYGSSVSTGIAIDSNGFTVNNPRYLVHYDWIAIQL